MALFRGLGKKEEDVNSYAGVRLSRRVSVENGDRLAARKVPLTTNHAHLRR